MLDAAEQLYALPLDQFTPARDDLARRLRGQGQREDAEAVKRLPKPSLTAWALNQVARGQPDLVDRVVEAAKSLQGAQRSLLSESPPAQARFRAASQEERAAVNRLLSAASEVLLGSGHPVAKAVTDRLEATIRAALAESEASEALRLGTLSRDLTPRGFGGLTEDTGALLWLPQMPPAAAEAPETVSTSRQPPMGVTAPPPDQPVPPTPNLLDMLGQRLLALRRRADRAESDAATARGARRNGELAVQAAREALARAEAEATKRRKAEEDAVRRLADLRTQIDDCSDQVAEVERERRGQH
ncbi:MAG: hypothetical protein KGJ86_03630 [Chloroflexota bacterium]|nr:hypothetical protein [Chloroflexota bacterium]